MDKTSEKVVELLQKVLGLSTVAENAALGETPRWDSLRHMRVLVAVEKEFSVKIPPDKFTQLISVEKIVGFLCSAKAG